MTAHSVSFRNRQIAPEEKGKLARLGEIRCMAKDDMVSKISKSLAEESGRDPEVLAYSLELLKSGVGGYVVLFLVTWALGIWPYALAAALTASILRVFSGGAHSATHTRCIISGTVVFTSLGLIAACVPAGFFIASPLVFAWAAAAVTGIVFLKYAPADTPNKPINSSVQRRYLRSISLGLLILWTAAALLLGLMIPILSGRMLLASSLGMLWQAFTLTPPGYGLIRLIDPKQPA